MHMIEENMVKQLEGCVEAPFYTLGPEFKPLEFESFSNCGEFATIKTSASRQANFGFNSLEFDGIRNQRKS